MILIQVLREDKLDLYKASPFELKLYRGLSHKLDKHYAEKYGISEDKKAPLKKGRKSYKKTKNLRVLRDTDARTAGRFKVRRGNNKSKRKGNNKSKRKG